MDATSAAVASLVVATPLRLTIALMYLFFAATIVYRLKTDHIPPSRRIIWWTSTGICLGWSMFYLLAFLQSPPMTLLSAYSQGLHLIVGAHLWTIVFVVYRRDGKS